MPGPRYAGRSDPGQGHRRSAGRRLQAAGDRQAALRPPDRDLIHGELVTFTDPQRDLPSIDRLEVFRPGGHSMYQRVMVAVLSGRTSIPAWIYWVPRIDTGIRLGSGV